MAKQPNDVDVVAQAEALIGGLASKYAGVVSKAQANLNDPDAQREKARALSIIESVHLRLALEHLRLLQQVVVNS